MESFNELMMRRRSSRKFTAEPIAPDQVQELLKAALVAPTSKNAHSWQFVAVEDREMLERLAACRKMGSSFLSGCALAVVVMGDVTVTDVWVEDASIAAAYMQLQAEDLGLGSCWCQVRNRHTPDDTEAEQYVRDLLDIPISLACSASSASGTASAWAGRTTRRRCFGSACISDVTARRR